MLNIQFSMINTQQGAKKNETLRGFVFLFNRSSKLNVTVNVTFQVTDRFFLRQDRFFHYITH
jgi:hypothetical protein